jgi:hypothetical protein
MVPSDWLRSDPLPWLLAPDSPGTRYLALRDIAGADPNGAELRRARRSAHRAGPIAGVLTHMDQAGYWAAPGPGYNPKYRSTVWAVILLAQLGARVEEDKRIRTACAYLLDHALAPGGQFTASGAPSGTADCLQGNVCWALLALGSDDPRLDGALEWMARSVTGEDVAPASARSAPVRYYAGKCGPTFACGSNNRLPCAWGGVKVMLAFSQVPAERRTSLMQRAVQEGAAFLLGTDPAGAEYPHGYSDKPSGNWWKFGFPVFYVTDMLQIVEALARLGYGHDPRLANAIRLVLDKQNAEGRWSLEYDYAGKTWLEAGPKRQPNRWVTWRALAALSAAASGATPARQ